MSASAMHADEWPIDVALVRRLLAAQFPRWAELPIERFASSGTVNALFRLGGDLAVRLPRIAGGAEGVELEHRWLPWLAPALPVPIPAVLGKGVPGDGFPWPWTVHRWLDGENPREGQVARPARLAADLAEFIVALRRIEPADGPPAYRGGPLGEVDEETRTAIGLLEGTIDTGAATAAWQEALAAPGWDGPPVWVHSDLMPGNLLVADGRLSAVIDFGTAGVGDPACDLIPAWNLLPASVREDFRTVLGVDDATWVRGRGWALSMALIQLPYYCETNPAMAANARHVIQEVLSETSSMASTSGAPLAVETGGGSP
ncbi:aminoglycoside phosphotransferase family protein [Streptomyces sp. PSAA01]|uniref:aminoglycoside phosphotransferase family protein n=1 Tax=Streptomyces sp. PSAA01 TaxID=2912762 RepID=UPI001F20D383|nr:aminoglycoside phosphotransferase family protein [Streptomyces sp. PSAA01]MCG0290535.1 aminoglycoside phosphotransferase family protein [Streptomyces sp. PSAA01]